ncbi:MAG: hypothetical protein JRJ42_01855 [Deltaproteobacteria bacterium]|nr:hypothetical protein [Deltaproteobacteria bacterium]MBW2018855.1 hypothetical protein [Deltaproteobacteria bacterium]MBW2073610.1 hypothetical protein [Deltaproteobacteria bacterium]
MSYWNFREELSRQDRMRRSIYETLRDELDEYLLQYGLVDSYQNFVNQHVPYPFVEKRELKPRARIPDVEYEWHNRFLVIFVEDVIPSTYKKNLRFFDDNKVTKENLMRSETVQFSKKYFRNIKLFESTHFSDFLKALLPVDYALLIQRDPTVKARNRYSLSHFHVRVDWPIADAAEDLARELRYISKDLYEKGEAYAEEIQRKFFEYYGFPITSGGRRTAAMVAAQFLRRVPCISTVYIGSSESRALYRISERGVSKYILMKLSNTDIQQIAEYHRLREETIRKNYLIAEQEDENIVIFQATYGRTSHARFPDDGKLRELNSEYFWMTVINQSILPKPGIWDKSPLPYSIIYT